MLLKNDLDNIHLHGQITSKNKTKISIIGIVIDSQINIFANIAPTLSSELLHDNDVNVLISYNLSRLI